jgi:hypothetical protein
VAFAYGQFSGGWGTRITWLQKFVFWQYWGLNSGPTPWVTLPSNFCDGLFRGRVLRTICLGWLRMVIFLISASWVARITGVSPLHPTESGIWDQPETYSKTCCSRCFLTMGISERETVSVFFFLDVKSQASPTQCLIPTWTQRVRVLRSMQTNQTAK